MATEHESSVASPPERGSACCARRSPTPTQGGLEALTMRQLAEELGVAPMALYRHVANKDDLIDGMVDLVFSEIELPSSGRGLEDRDAAARDRGPRRPATPSLGDRPDGVAAEPRVRRTCDTTTR